MRHSKKTQAGFSLLELLITISILGILAAVAIPNYLEYAQRGRRADAMNGLMKIAAEQEKYYLDNNTYFDNTYLCAQAWANNCISESGFYKFTVTNTSPTGDYLATAEPNGLPQTQDKQCATLSVDQSNRRTATGTNPGTCW